MALAITRHELLYGVPCGPTLAMVKPANDFEALCEVLSMANRWDGWMGYREQQALEMVNDLINRMEKECTCSSADFGTAVSCPIHGDNKK